MRERVTNRETSGGKISFWGLSMRIALNSQFLKKVPALQIIIWFMCCWLLCLMLSKLSKVLFYCCCTPHIFNFLPRKFFRWGKLRFCTRNQMSCNWARERPFNVMPTEKKNLKTRTTFNKIHTTDQKLMRLLIFTKRYLPEDVFMPFDIWQSCVL